MLVTADKLICNILQCFPSHECWLTRKKTFIQQLCLDIRYCPQNLPCVMTNRDGWWEWVKGIHAISTTGRRWWWWWYIIVKKNCVSHNCCYICIYISQTKCINFNINTKFSDMLISLESLYCFSQSTRIKSSLH